MFDLSLPKLLILAVLALVVFGPNELPKIASQAGRFLRDLRRIAEGAQSDLREGLGPDFADFDVSDLNPRKFVTKHLLSDPGEAGPDEAAPDEAAPDQAARDQAAPDQGGPDQAVANLEGVSARDPGDALVGVSDGQRAAYDTEAT